MRTLIKVDLHASPESHEVLHNRWHPDIPMVAYVKPGDEFRVECVDVYWWQKPWCIILKF